MRGRGAVKGGRGAVSGRSAVRALTMSMWMSFPALSIFTHNLSKYARFLFGLSCSGLSFNMHSKAGNLANMANKRESR